MALLVSMGLTMAFCAEASTVSVTFLSADTGVTNGTDYVLPYQLSIDGITTDATCYDIFDDVTFGQSWTANVLTTAQAIAEGQFSSAPNAAVGYDEIAFLSQQTTSSPQDQIDLQEDIWNVFGGDPYPVTTGMQNYLNLLATSAYSSSFDFGSVDFLEDVNQGTGRAQAFVVHSSPGLTTVASIPEPGTMMLLVAGLLAMSVTAFRSRNAGRR